MGENPYVQARNRVIGLVVYALLLLVIQWKVVATGLTPNENAIWAYSGFASLLFGSRLLNPHFTPPADAATNSFVALAAIVAGSLVVPADLWELTLIWAMAIFCTVICLTAVVVLLVRVPVGVETRLWVRAADRAVRSLGSPSVIFTVLILACIWLFHRARIDEAIAILTAWAVIVALRPVEAFLAFGNWVLEQQGAVDSPEVVGPVAAHQSPGIVLVRQLGNSSVERGTPLVVVDNNGPWMLGVALNYVGRDEGNLLRVLTVRLPDGLKDRIGQLPDTRGAAMALALSATPEELADVPAIQWINPLCGVVVSDTGSDHVLFEVTEERGLAEGRLVEGGLGNFMSFSRLLKA